MMLQNIANGESGGSVRAKLNGNFAELDARPPTYGDWFLRNSRLRLRRLKDGVATQCVMAFFGDSWIQGGYWILQFAKSMQTSYGFAGLGWVGFQYFGTASGTWVDGGTQPSGGGAGCARSDLSAAPVFSGAWTSDNGAGGLASPSIGDVFSTTVDAYVRFGFPAGHTGADLHYAGDGTGVVKYSWDGGSTWSSNLALDAVGQGSKPLENVPSSDGTLRIAVVSGNVRLTGVNMKSTATGVVVHKLGASGSNSAQWSAIDLEEWAGRVASLGVHLVGGLLGTNDQSGSGRPPAVFAANVDAIMTALHAESPAIDRLWISPAENARPNNAVPMTAYAAAVRAKAVAGRYAYLDLQHAFGVDVSEYESASDLALLDGSGTHPAASSGGAVISDCVHRLIVPV